MKIAIADNAGTKFCKDIIEHWQNKGHEVRYERGASEYLAQWADIYYVEWIDNNLNYLWKLYNGVDGVSRTPDWDNNKKPKIVCRMIDWDLWCGFVPFYEEAYMNFIDVAICIAPHMQDYILEKAPGYKDKLHLIRPGVNLEKFTVKSTVTDGFQLGMVLGDLWWYKNHMGGLDIFTQLYRQDNRWRLHLRGQHEPGAYNPRMFEYYLESRGIKDAVTLYPPVDDMNQWYEQIDIMLHPGMKETFVYAVAEPMAKGIPVIVNDFLGSQDIWDANEYMIYQTHEEAVEIINCIKDKEFSDTPIDWRNYIEAKYDVKRMLKEYDEVLGT